MHELFKYRSISADAAKANESVASLLYAKYPRGKAVEIGAVWRKFSQARQRDYFTLTINTGFGKLQANLGQMAGQDDDDLYAIIPWSD